MGRISEFAMHFLVNAAWQIAAVVIGASICARLLRNAAARYRHAMWVASSRALSRASALGSSRSSNETRSLQYWSQRPGAVQQPESITSTPEAFARRRPSLTHPRAQRSQARRLTPNAAAIRGDIAESGADARDSLCALRGLSPGVVARVAAKRKRFRRSACKRELPPALAVGRVAVPGARLV